ncbi:MAG: hypothetical protein GEV07_28800 [Streptosporangiales bacterium]|nr:hypothetical protein [Streptosporangiales bacterium]
MSTKNELPTVARPPSTWRQWISSIGPGFFVAMAWLGTGDLIDNSVAGANYGYALLWALVVALVAKFFFVNALSKYQLGNVHGDDSPMQGFARAWRPLSLLVAISIGVLIFVYESYFIVGAGTAIHHLTGQAVGGEYGIFLWSVVAVAASIGILFSGREYRIMEVFARVTVALLVLTFVISAVIHGPDLVEVGKGLLYELPANKGAFGSIILAVAIMGAVGVTPATVIYCYAIRERGWRGPEFRKLAVVDALLAVAAIAVIDISIWVTAAQTMYGSGDLIDGTDGLVLMMERAMGPAGPVLMWLAVFFVTFSSMASTAYIYSKVVADGIRYSRRNQSAGSGESTRFVHRLAIVGLVLPLVFSLPQAPDFVILTVLGSAISVACVPLVVAGIFYVTSSRRHMRPESVNKPWEIVALLVISALAVVAVYGLGRGLVESLAGIAG